MKLCITFVHFNVAELMRNFNYDAHPMGLFISGVAAMSTFHPDANPALVVCYGSMNLKSGRVGLRRYKEIDALSTCVYIIRGLAYSLKTSKRGTSKYSDC